jgi:hypothetical protein
MYIGIWNNSDQSNLFLYTAGFTYVNNLWLFIENKTDIVSLYQDYFILVK